MPCMSLGLRDSYLGYQKLYLPCKEVASLKTTPMATSQESVGTGLNDRHNLQHLVGIGLTHLPRTVAMCLQCPSYVATVPRGKGVSKISEQSLLWIGPQERAFQKKEIENMVDARVLYAVKSTFNSAQKKISLLFLQTFKERPM